MDSVWDYQYATDLPVEVCVQRILQQPWEFFCEWGTSLWYECQAVSPTRIMITFTGGQFRKIKCTQYYADFVEQNGKTVITMRFYKELFNSSPFTIPSGIDSFMIQKNNAERIKTSQVR